MKLERSNFSKSSKLFPVFHGYRNMVCEASGNF